MEAEICDWCGQDDDTVEWRAEAAASICDDCLNDFVKRVWEEVKWIKQEHPTKQ